MGLSWSRTCGKKKKVSQPGNDMPHTHVCAKPLKHTGLHLCKCNKTFS